MIANRQLSLDDYLALLRRHLKTILLPAILAPAAGFLVSYAFPPKYTSQATVLVQGQRLPEGVVQPVVTEELSQRVEALKQQVLSRSRLKPVVEGLGLVRSGQSIDDVIVAIRSGIQIEPVESDADRISSPSSGKKRPAPKPGTEVPAFTVSYTASSPTEARDVCQQVTSMIVQENIDSRQRAATDTTAFIERQLEQAKKDLDDQDSKLADFKKQYAGQLPGDEDSNLKLLTALNTQLDANTQTISRAQQDKAYTESMLAQQLAAWRLAQGSTNPQSLQQQLTQLQSQLLQLQARYTDDHPDVIKTKADIAEVKKRLAELNSESAQGTDSTPDKVSSGEPAEIRQLRLQVHQYTQVLDQATREQKRLADAVRMYQSRLAVSPEVEEKYKQLSRDYDTAQKFYADLLAKKGSSAMTQDMESRQQGEQMTVMYPAGLPTDPSFPNRLFFAAAGLAAALAVGLAIAVWLELRDKSMKDERDVEASLQMPVLVSIPWLIDESHNGNGGRISGTRNGHGAREKVNV